jgi:S-ribosylhomocysteine lyase LuxS involved in autoinducer biosynthesis
MEKIETGVACGRMGVRRGVYMVFVGKPSKRNHFGDAG